MALGVPKVIYEDTHVLVLDKPAGWLSQGDASGEPSVVDWLRKHVGRNYVGLVHRLDRNTSGLLLIAKRSKAASRLAESLRVGDVRRTYLAWLYGRVPDRVAWEHWLVKDRATNIVRVAGPNAAGAKPARLAGRMIRRGHVAGKAASLVEFELETGRSHQIRVQAAHEGYAVIGDAKYREGKSSRATRLALHSHTLEFTHPMTKERLRFCLPLPNEAELFGPRAVPAPKRRPPRAKPYRRRT